MARPKISVNTRLTRRQELFVKELVSKDGQITMREAAINAGYAPGSAHARAYDLLNPETHPNVVAAVKAYRRELDEKYSVDYRRHLRDLQRIRDLAIQNGAYGAAVQAEYRRGLAHGDIYVSKSEVRHGTIDSMSKEEVMKALEEIKQSYGTIIEVNPERKSISEGEGTEGSVLLGNVQKEPIEVEPEHSRDED